MNQSIWITQEKKKYQKITEEKVCEICIVGGGLSGLLCAWQLSKKYHVILIEADEIGNGASGRNTGKISSQHGFNYQKILELHGKENTKHYYQANQKAIQDLHAITVSENLDVEWQEKESVVGCKSVEETEHVANEMKAYDICEIDYEVVRENEIEGIRYGARFTHQASFQPYAFCVQLAEKIKAEIYEHSPFIDIHENYVLCNDHKIYFKQVIFATQVLPFRFPPSYLVTTPLQSYLAALKPSKKSKIMTLSEEKITRTSNSSVHYEIAGGYDHHVDEDKETYWKNMKRMLEEEYSGYEVKTMWASQDYRSSDYLPLVGKMNGMYVISGFNKWGNTNAMVASQVIADLMEGKENPLIEILKPTRFSLYANMQFVQENTRVIKSLIQSKLQDKTFTIPQKYEGVSVTINNHPYGIYLDENYHIVDLICTHLGCTLGFNSETKTWDCPCHGSIFDVDGKVVKGPARQCLHATTLSALEIQNVVASYKKEKEEKKD